MNDLDPAVARMIDATNREDTDAFLAAFAADAVVDDWGTDMRAGNASHAGITRTTSENTADSRSPGHRRWATGRQVSVMVSGDGFNGPSTFEFDVRDGLITRFAITGLSF